jgi:hypothetical protein
VNFFTHERLTASLAQVGASQLLIDIDLGILGQARRVRRLRRREP